jgi:hypothetical protein
VEEKSEARATCCGCSRPETALFFHSDRQEIRVWLRCYFRRSQRLAEALDSIVTGLGQSAIEGLNRHVRQTDMLMPDMKRVIEEQRLGFVATAAPDGTPNVSPKGSFAARCWR